MRFRASVLVPAAIAVVLMGGLLVVCKKPAPLPSPPPPQPTPLPTPTPIPALVRKPFPTATLFNGLSLESAVVAVPGKELASRDRKESDAYTVEVTIRAQLPRPATTLEDLSASDRSLNSVFKNLPELLAHSSVSPFFKKLYELKTADLQRNVSRLDAVLSRHNFFDCETILEIQNPVTSRRAMLILADMDVNTDGTDGDRNFKVDGSSPTFLPQTSYRWPKQTERVNPFLAVEEKKFHSFTAELSQPDLKPARIEELKAGIDLAKRRINDLKKWSFLISETDPFIVLPGFMMRDSSAPFAPKIGDYAVVLYNGKGYPAILGDAGPSHKMGEASLILCKELNKKTSNIARPVSDLKVTYLIFPGSAEPKNTPPDLDAWRQKCLLLTEELGGLHAELHQWPNLVPAWPTPTPSPTPSATPLVSPSPSPTPEVTPSPDSSTHPTPEHSPQVP